jgi:multiple sugar transport system substrate-binding protein
MASPRTVSALVRPTSRRALLGGALGVGAAVLAACTPSANPTPVPKPARAQTKPGPAAPTTAPAAAAPTTAPAAATSAPAAATKPADGSAKPGRTEARPAQGAPGTRPTEVAKPAAAAPAPGKAVTEITYANYSAGADRPLWEKVGGDFSQRFPQYTVKYTPVAGDSWGEYFDKLATQIAGGNPPDVVRVAIEGTLLFVAKGLALPYDDLMKGDREIEEFKKDVNQRLLDTFVVDGKTYEFPLDWNNMVIFYNVAHFNEAGIPEPKGDWSFDQFLDTAKKLTKRPTGGGDPNRYGFGFAIQYFAAAMPWIFNAGSNLLSDDWAKSNANDPKLIEALTFMRDMIWEHKVSPKPPSNNNDNQNLFVSAKISMMGGGRWPVLYLDQQKFAGEFNVVAWPKGRDQVTEFGVGGFPIMKATKKQDAAWAWVKYLTNKEVFEYFAELGSSIPGRRSVAYDEKVMSKRPPKNWKLYYDSIEAPNARPVPSPPEYNVVESIFRRYLGVVFANEQPVKSAMEAAHKEISDTLAKRPKEWAVKSALLK